MSTGVRRALWSLPFGVAAFWAFWSWAGSSAPARLAADPSALPAAAPSGETGEPEAPRDAWAWRQLCGRPWEAAFSGECLAALERRHQSKVPGFDTSNSNRGHFRPVMLGAPVTWAQVFDATAEAVTAAHEALARAECLVPEGRIHIELRERCAADALAKLAILRAECTWGVHKYDSLESRQQWWDIDMRQIREAVEQEEYQRRLARLDDKWFGRLWRIGKCRNVPDEALGALGPFPRPVGFGNIGNEQIDLMKAAARLGSDWALSSVLWYPQRMFAVGEAYIDMLARERPVLAELLRMRRADGVERIMHAVVSFRLGQALGVQVDPVGVLHFTGEIDVEERRGAWRLAAPRLMDLGWTLVVADAEGGTPLRFETPADLWGDEQWTEWERERRVTLAPAPQTPPA